MCTYHDGLEHLVADTGQHALVEVDADLGENLGQLVLHGPRQHAQGDVDVLQVLGPRHGVDDARLAPHVEEVRRLLLAVVGGEVGVSNAPVDDQTFTQNRGRLSAVQLLG